MGDHRVENQLTSGFYAIESAGWRWTARRFSVLLGPSSQSGVRGARLEVSLYVPKAQLDALGPLTVSADIDDCPLGSETYSQAGTYVYVRDIAPARCATNVLPVKFTVDGVNSMSEGENSKGLVVSSISLRTR
jgi:hypothetical protein